MVSTAKPWVPYMTTSVEFSQVASGAFKSKDRDAALKQMIYLAASRHDPNLEASEAAAAAAAAVGGTAGNMEGRSASSDLKLPATSLRKISLTAVRFRSI